VCAISEERYSLFKNGTDAPNRGRPDYKWLVFGETVSNPITLEHHLLRRVSGSYPCPHSLAAAGIWYRPTGNIVFNNLMTPLLCPGDVAIFQVTGWSGDGVYVYRMRGDLYMSHVKSSGTAYRLTKELGRGGNTLGRRNL
jgi:hypothetical protein